MTEDGAISRAYDAMHSEPPDAEEVPTCTCGEPLLSAFERRHERCGYCIDAAADYARDVADAEAAE